MPKTFAVILLLLRDLKSVLDGFFISLGFKLCINFGSFCLRYYLPAIVCYVSLQVIDFHAIVLLGVDKARVS